MIDEREWVKHAQPAWGDRSNYIANCDLHISQLPFKWEQLWLQKMPDASYKVCCIPFFAFGIHLGDIVTLSSEGVVESIVTPSGHWTLRLLFSPTFNDQDEVLQWLETTGVKYEKFSRSLYSLDTTDAEHAISVMSFLDSHMEQGHLEYETGWL